MSPKLKRALMVVGASVLGVGIVATSALAMSGNLPTLFAVTPELSEGTMRTDPVTLGTWTDMQPGEVWTDKSVWASELRLSDEQQDVVLTPDEHQFGVGLSVMARGDALSSDVEFRDDMERYMEVKAIDGLFHKNEYHAASEFTGDLASGNITGAFERAVEARIQTDNVQRLIDDAKAAGQLTGNNNYIEWYGNRSNYQTFDQSEAKFLNRSYFFTGVADTPQKSMSIDVRVTTDLETGSQRLYFTVPHELVPVADDNALDAQPMRLFYQTGVVDDPEFSMIDKDYQYQDSRTVELFAGNGSAKYVPVNAKEGTVNKSENITNRDEFVSKTVMSGNEAHVMFGNNGRVKLLKTSNVDIINKFSEDGVHPGTADSFEYDILFNYDKVDVLKTAYKTAVIDAGGKVVKEDVLAFTGNSTTKNAKVRISSNQTLRIYDICPGIEVSIDQTESSDGFYLVSQSVDNVEIDLNERPKTHDEMDPGITSKFLFINNYKSPDGFRIPVYETIENHPYRGQVFFDIEPLEGAPAPKGPQGNEACITWVEELDVQTKSTAFGPIVFTDAGDYKYRITMRAPGTDRLTHDKSRYDVTVHYTPGQDPTYDIVKALDNLGNAINGEHADKALFTSTFTIKEETYQSGLGVSKKYVNGTWQDDLFKALVRGEVTESLWPVDEVPMFANVENGEIALDRQNSLLGLGTVEISVPGTYTYYIKEDLGDSPHIKYSTVEYKIVVTAVSDNGYIKSSCVVYTKPDDMNSSPWEVHASNNMNFQNEYIGPEYRTLTITKDVDSRDEVTHKFGIDVEFYDFDPIDLTKYDVTVPDGCSKSIKTKGFEENGKTGTVVSITLGDGDTAVIKNIPKGVEYYVFETDLDEREYADSYSIPQRGLMNDNLNMVVTNTRTNPTLPFSLGGTSKLTGGTPSGSVYFEYCLEGVDNAPMPEERTLAVVYNSAIGSQDFNFDSVVFDKEGTYEYIIHQRTMDKSAPGVTYDKSEYGVTVKVTKNGNTLVATPSYVLRKDNTGNALAEFRPVNKVEFNEKYASAPAEGITFKGVGKLDGDRWTGELYYTIQGMTIKGMYDAPMPKYTVSKAKFEDAIGKKELSFGPITFDKPGTYVYWVTQAVGTDINVEYDEGTYQYTVVVTDNGGKLEAAITMDWRLNDQAPWMGMDGLAMEFHSKYTRPAIGDAEFKMYISKNFTVEKPLTSDTTFMFELTGKDGAPMPSFENTARGTLKYREGQSGKERVYFPVIRYTEPGDYHYTLREVNTGVTGVKYDKTEYAVDVLVKRNVNVYAAIPSFTKIKDADGNPVNEKAGGAIFDNEYSVVPGSIDLAGTVKVLNGSLYKGSFDFEIEPQAGAPAPEKLTTTVTLDGTEVSLGTDDGETEGQSEDGDGDEDPDPESEGPGVGDPVQVSVNFGTVHFDRAGTYKYIVRQKAPATSDDMVYDQSEYEITVTVTEKDSKLEIESDFIQIKNTAGEPVEQYANVSAVFSQVRYDTTTKDVFTRARNQASREGLAEFGAHYKVTVKNDGLGDARNVIVNVPLLEGMTTDDGMSGAGANAFYHVIDELPAGQSVDLTFTANFETEEITITPTPKPTDAPVDAPDGEDVTKTVATIGVGSYTVKATYQWDGCDAMLETNELELQVVNSIGALDVTAPEVPAVVPPVHEPVRGDNGIYWENNYSQLIEVTARKMWLIDDTLLPPVPVRVQLYADDQPMGAPVTLNANCGWQYTWTKLDGKKNYRVDEVGVPDGFEKIVDSVGNYWTITNDDLMGDLREGDLMVQAEWITDHGRDVPESLTVQLYSDGIPFSESVTLTAAKSWKYAWHNLDDEHEWSVGLVDEVKGFDKFVEVNGQVWNLKFDDTPIFPDPKNVSVRMDWILDDGRERPETVAVQLYKDEEPFGDPVLLCDENEWFHMWANLDGAYEYTVDEVDLPDTFTKFVQYKGYDWEIRVDDKSIEDVTSVSVVKVWDNVPQWRFEPVAKPSSGDKDTDEKYGLGIYGELGDTILEERPSMVPEEVMVQLMVGGASVGDPVALNDGNGWQYTWDDLDPKNEYTVKEVTQLANYEVTYGNNESTTVITNKYVPTWTEDIPVKVLWNVSDKGIIPDSVKIQLYQDGTPYGEPVEVTKADGWSYTFTNLSAGHVYNITQAAMEGFEATITEEDGTIVIANKVYEPQETPKPSTKPDDGNHGSHDTPKPGETPEPDDDKSGETPKPDDDNNGGNNNGGNNSGNNSGNNNGSNDGDNNSNNGGVGVGGGNGTGNDGTGTGINNNGTGNGNKTDNNALANPNKNNPNTGVGNNSIWLWVALGVLLVAGLGAGGWFLYRRKTEG